MAKTVSPRRGEVFIVDFDPTVGAEIAKPRPALIIQNDTANRSSEITIVAACTSKVIKPLYPVEVFIPAGEGGLNRDSVVVLNQIRSIDKQRLGRRLGRLGRQRMREVDRALLISMDLTQNLSADESH